MTITKIRKRDGRLEVFSSQKIANSISKALKDAKIRDGKVVKKLTEEVLKTLDEKFFGKIPSSEDVEKIIEGTFVKNKLSKAAKVYIAYRTKKGERGKFKTFFGVVDDLKLGINAIKILERRYLKKNEKGNVIETPSQMFRRVASLIAEVEKSYGKNENEVRKSEEDFFKLMSGLEFLPNTPTLMNVGTKLGNLSACYVLPIDDSIESIFETLKITAIIHKEGGGTGFSFSKLRPKGDVVKTTGGSASGPISFMEVFDKMTDVVKQGGRRRGANIGILRVDHPDILDFISIKAQPGKLENFNLSVAVTDEFMKAVEKNKDYSLINPRNRQVVKKLKAKEVFDLIVMNAWRYGDPGLIFIDEINRKNPTRQIGEIEATNPCGEVPLHPWEACNLGSINLVKMFKGNKFDWNKLKKIIPICIRFLDNVIDANRYSTRQIEEIVKSNRRIGLGVMGFAEALIKQKIPYNSEKALQFAERLMKFIEKESHNASQNLGKEKGSFPNFKGSLWQKKGYKFMRNATVTTIAPTGTISIIAGCSSGIEPLFAVSFVRNVMEGARLLEVNPIFEEVSKKGKFFSTDLLTKIANTGSVRDLEEIPESVKNVFVTALDIDPEWHVRIQAVFQKYTDNAVSKTINMKREVSPEEVRKVYTLAWRTKCKGITVYRYGSKPEQVLTIGPLEKEIGEKHVIADTEYSGGCAGFICPH